VIRVVLSRPKKRTPISWFIAKVIRFEASHATLHVVGHGLLKDSWLVFEATGSRGVSVVHQDVWYEKNEAVRVYELVENADSGREALGNVWRLMGHRYDFAGLLYFGLRLLLRRAFRLKLPAMLSPDVLFCSELVTKWLESLMAAVNCPLELKDPDDTTPKDLDKLLSESCMFERKDEVEQAG
jgi:hypothetical protein